MNFVVNDEQSVIRQPIVRTRARVKAETKKKLKSFNIVLDENGVKKVERIKELIYPSTQTEVFRAALQLLDEIIEEVDNGSEIYIKRKGSSKCELYEIMD